MGTNIFLIFNRYMIIKFMSDSNWKKKKIPQNQQIFFFPILQLFPIFRKDIHGFQIGNLMKDK